MATNIIPSLVVQYLEKEKLCHKLRAEMATLRPQVASWLTNLPRRAFPLGDGRLRLATIRRHEQISESMLVKLLGEFLSKGSLQDSTEQQRMTFATAAAAYVFAGRGRSICTQVQRIRVAGSDVEALMRE